MSSEWALPTAGLIAYLVGSLPFGYLTGRIVAGIDIRKAGSGNIGATNAGRLLGAKWGLFVLGMDALKGLLPVLFLPRLLISAPSMQQHAEVLCGVATIVGHMFPCWLGFRGGKGVATALGVVAVVAPVGTLIAAGAFLLLFLLFRIVSLGSIGAAVAFAVAQIVILAREGLARERWSLWLFSLAVPLLIIVRHRSNIGRLWRGEEKAFRFGSGKNSPQPPQPPDVNP